MPNENPGMLYSLLNVVWATAHIADVLITKANSSEDNCLLCDGERVKTPGTYPDEFHFDHTDECSLVTLEGFKAMVDELPNPDENDDEDTDVD